ncbi:MAG: Hpt domain-containing protein [Rhodospirillaceae bacterium]|nr:Hpt domain-containing protein [Rhodospirillaceae bacterium]
MFKNGTTEEQIIANMRDDFLADATKRLTLLRENLAAARRRDCENDPFVTFRAEVHTLKGMGQAFGFPSLTLISRRLEGYLRNHSRDAFATDDDIDGFLESIAGVISAGEEPGDDKLDDILDSLPPPVPED